MSVGFIEPVRSVLFGDIESRIFKFDDVAQTTLMINVMPPGSKAEPHRHDEHQIGLCLSGSFTAIVNGEARAMPPLAQCYWAPGGTLHGGRNDGDEPAITLDIKRLPQPQDVQLTRCPLHEFFLPLSQAKQIKGGLDLRFFIGPWFEIMHSRLAPGATMPRHAHRGIQIGVGLTGTYTMEVADEARPFGRHDVYFAGEHVPHAGLNHTEQEATSLNVFIPPRWNLLPVNQRSVSW